MRAFLLSLLDFSILLFAVSSMLSVGLSHSMPELLAPLRRGRRVLLELLGNFALVPLLAWGLVRLLSLDRSLEVGLVLVATAAGSPFAIKLTQLARGDVGLGAAVLLLLLLGSIVYMPLVVPLVVPEVQVSARAIAKPLVLLMLLPLAFGQLFEILLPGPARRLQPFLGKLSTLSLTVLVTATFLLNFPMILGIFGTGAILAALVLIGGAFVIGYLMGLLGGKKPRRRGVVALATAQRNISAAAVVATQGFHDSGALVMVVICSLVGLALLFPIARWMGQRARQEDERGEGGRSDMGILEGNP